MKIRWKLDENKRKIIKMRKWEKKIKNKKRNKKEEEKN